MADTRIMKFMGANVERKAKYTDYSLTDMFDQKIQQKVDRYHKLGERFEYTEGFSAEVQTFVKTNYDPNEYHIDFKQLIKQKKEREKQEMLEAGARALRSSSQRTSEDSIGAFKVAKAGQNNLEHLEALYEKYDPKKLQVKPGVYDFRLA